MGKQINSLIVIDSQGVRVIDIGDYNKENIVIGREPERCDIVVSSQAVSRRHLYFIRKNGDSLLYDEGSTNGTYVLRGTEKTDIRGNEPYIIETDVTIVYLSMEEPKGTNAMLIFSADAKANWTSFKLKEGENYIGRSKECAVHLPDLSVSRKHAVIYKQGDSLVLSDNRSLNGVMHNGVLVNGAEKLNEPSIIQIVSNILIVHNGYVLYSHPISGVSVDIQHVGKRVGKGKVILRDVSCSIKENEFVAIIGGSGAGKTTLMNAISGFDNKITGNIQVNGSDLRQNFDTLKSIIGFVPQQDIIYENLTLQGMLEYTARMKMEKTVTAAERRERIDKVLEMVELKEHKNTYIRKLSGGQKKRASIAVELLADPKLFFLDEPTSGLDPGTEQNLMKTLRKLAKEQGKTIVMVTHTTQSLDLCDKIIIMGTGGRLCYMGTPENTLQFFHTDNLVNVYNMVSSNAEYWERKYKEENADSGKGAAEEKEKIKAGKISLLNQFIVLTQRYANLLINDKQRLFMLLIQPLAIAGLIGIVAGEEVFEKYEDTKSILFSLTCSGIWLGLFNTIQEICKERIILKREYMSNLKLPIYILSKYVVQALLATVQTIIILAGFLIAVGMPEKGVIFGSGLFECAITVFFTIYSSASLGLIISSFVKNSDRAMTFAPFVLIIQLLFSGILFKLEGAVDAISKITISRWSIEGLGVTADLNSLPSKTGMPREIEKIFEHTAAHEWQVWLILAVFTILFGAAAAVMLRNVSRDQR